MSLVPNGRSAVIAVEKLTKYLFVPNHPDNSGKDKFFRSKGFDPNNLMVIVEALKNHPLTNQVSAVIPSSYGVKYVVDCSIISPDGSNPCVRSIWIIDKGDNQPRFVSAYPNS